MPALLVGVGAASMKSVTLLLVRLTRVRLEVPSPGARVVGVPEVGPPMKPGSVLVVPLYPPYATQSV